MENNITSLISYIQKRKKSTKENIKERFLNALFDFEISFKNILTYHITGTNGKGSTVKYLSRLLCENKLNVGEFISPYIYNFNERISICGKNISDDDLKKYINIVLEYEKKINYEFSFFEIITLIAFIYFKNCKVDAIVIEVGIGGLYDITNLINYKYSAITNISYDHQNILGKKLNDIFLNKLGILKPHQNFITTVDRKYHKKIIKRANLLNSWHELIRLDKIKILSKSSYSYIYDDLKIELSSYAEYEVYNSLLAVKLFLKEFPRYDIKKINEALKNTELLGRFEIYENYILDGAHNKAGLQAFFKSLKNKYKIDDLEIIYSVLDGKDARKNIGVINKYFKKSNYLTFPDPRCLNVSSLPSNFKSSILNGKQDLKKYLDENKNKKIVITGSIHLLGYIKKYLK